MCDFSVRAREIYKKDERKRWKTEMFCTSIYMSASQERQTELFVHSMVESGSAQRGSLNVLCICYQLLSGFFFVESADFKRPIEIECRLAE